MCFLFLSGDFVDPTSTSQSMISKECRVLLALVSVTESFVAAVLVKFGKVFFCGCLIKHLNKVEYVVKAGKP